MSLRLTASNLTANYEVIRMRLRVGRSVWLIHVPPRRRYPILTGKQHADVVIVGGGMTGASIAYRFATAGLNVAVVEASLVGRGSTGASTALLLQETDEELSRLARRYGQARANRIWELSREATRGLIDTTRHLGIRCDLIERDTMYYTIEREAVDRLRAEYRRRRHAGFSATWMNPATLLAETGIPGVAAIRSKGNALLNPYRACVGLLDAARAKGARIFERSRVRRIDKTRTGVIVRTPRGAITAERVIVATGFATPAFKPLAGRFRMKHTYVLATARLSPGARAKLGLRDVMLWDTARPYHYVRWTADHRLLLGGNDRPVVRRSRRAQAFAASTRELRSYFENVRPALSEIDVEFAWEGLFAMTPDGLPYIGPHRRYPRHLFALGYGGNGMTFGFLAARLLLDAFRNVPNPDLELFAFNRGRFGHSA